MADCELLDCRTKNNLFNYQTIENALSPNPFFKKGRFFCRNDDIKCRGGEWEEFDLGFGLNFKFFNRIFGADDLPVGPEE